MFDRRYVTDIGLALLIALPSALPAAPNPWGADDEIGRPDATKVDEPGGLSQQVRFAEGVPISEPRYGRS